MGGHPPEDAENSPAGGRRGGSHPGSPGDVLRACHGCRVRSRRRSRCCHAIRGGARRSGRVCPLWLLPRGDHLSRRPWDGGARNVGSWVARRGVRRVRFVQMIQKLGKPLGILQKEPAHHCLKSRSPAVAGWITAPGAPARPVAALAHQRTLPVVEQWLEPLQRPGLGLGPHLGHHRLVELIRAAGPVAVPQTLVELPDRISQPGELQGTQPVGLKLMTGIGPDLAQPGASVGFRVWQGRPGPCPDRAEGAGTAPAAPA